MMEAAGIEPALVPDSEEYLRGLLDDYDERPVSGASL
jgi:hypothetical protein